MNVLIISGFLGAGKTTFIRALRERTGKDLAVFENEFGAASIDGEILRKETSAGELNIWEMTEGCICCSMKGDFASSVLTIANTVSPEVLVIEPTGIGFLSNIIANLQQIEYENIRLLKPVTIVDGLSVGRYSKEYESLYADQVSASGTVFISKLEHASAEEKAKARARLLEIAPASNVVAEHYSAMAKEEWLKLLETALDGRSLRRELPKEEDMPTPFTLKEAAMDAPERLLLMLEDLLRGSYGDIIRAKGVIGIGGFKYRFDVADGRYGITGAAEDALCQAVFIGRDVKRAKIRRCFFQRA